MPPEAPLGIGMVGYAFMGRAHSQAWLAAREFFRPPLRPELSVLAGRNPEAAGTVARAFGWAAVTSDWRTLLDDDRVGLIDICTPGDTHAEIAIAALEAGRHVLVEKPMTNSVADAEAMVRAATQARARGVRAMVGFTYRRVPALALARRLVAEGRLGRIQSVRAEYLQDWLSDADAPWTWRLDREVAGSGALGDIGAHIVDLVQFVTGQRVTAVSGALDTTVERRVDEGGTERPVTVDDTAAFLATLDGATLATFVATRVATGRKNALRLEVSGDRGALAFDLEDMNHLQFFDAADGDVAGFRRIMVTESTHPYLSAWWPPGHSLGYEQPFTHQAVDLLDAIATGRDPEPSFEDGLAVQRVLGAVSESAQTGRWVSVEPRPVAVTS